MLTHKAIGPYEDGSYLVVYPTPGCGSLTVACDCRTESQATREVERLNKLQLHREQNIRRDRELRGLGGVYHGGLDGR
jgi:hypothetical protein